MRHSGYVSFSKNIPQGRRKYRIIRLPEFLVINIKRFTKNNFFWEKNPSIVNFPVKGLDLKASPGVDCGWIHRIKRKIKKSVQDIIHAVVFLHNMLFFLFDSLIALA